MKNSPALPILSEQSPHSRTSAMNPSTISTTQLPTPLLCLLPHSTNTVPQAEERPASPRIASSVINAPATSKNQNTINVSLLNIRSVRNKCIDIIDLILDRNLHIFCLVETWLQNGQSALIASFVPDTHVFHHVPRSIGKGGGVGIVISKIFENVKAYDRSNEQYECIELHASYGGRKLVLSVVYRPPNKKVSDFISLFENHILELEKSEKKCSLSRRLQHTHG